MRPHSRLLRLSSSAILASLLWLVTIPLFGVHVHLSRTPIAPVIHAHDKQSAHDRGRSEIPKNTIPNFPSDLLLSGKLKKDDSPAKRGWDLPWAIIPSALWMSPNAPCSGHVHDPVIFDPSGPVPRFRSIRAPPDFI